MKTLLLFGMVFAVLAPGAEAHVFDVLVRTPSGSWKIEKQIIDLKEGTAGIESKNFKMVQGKSETPIALDSKDDSLVLKAGTALYHLEKARAYFTENMGSDYVQSLGQLTIRLELINRFSELGHFMHDNREPQYNNALSIPAGTPIAGQNIQPWKTEIWFRPKKEIPTSEILKSLPEDPTAALFRQIRGAVYPMQLENGLRTAVYYLFSNMPMHTSFWEAITRQAGTLLMTEGALQVSRLVNRAALPKSYFIDSAMVPEIIYHEFSHIALSDSMVVSHSTPVIEGMADYFASLMSGGPKLAKKIKKFSTAMGKNGKTKKYFDIEFESLDRANADFVLGLLWGLRPVLGEGVATQVIFEARKSLSTRESDIRNGLVGALLKACDQVCYNPGVSHLKLLQYFQERGI